MKRNYLLLAILSGLIVLFIATNYFKKNRSSIFKPEVVHIDSSLVQKIVIHPPFNLNEGPIVISRKVDRWEVSQDSIFSKAKESMVKNVLGQLLQVEAERLVSKSRDKWRSYGLTDSLALRIEIQKKGNEVVSKLYFGKSSYEQPNVQGTGRGVPNGSIYFRVGNKPETFAMSNQLSNAFNRKFNAWRNSQFIKVDKDLVTQLNFKRLEEGDFFVAKTDSVWKMGMVPADSTKVARYLNNLQSQSSSQFVDTFSPKSKADYTLTVRGKSMKELIVNAYRDSLENKYVLSSSQHPDVFIESDSAAMFKRLFVNKDYFLNDQD